MSDQIRGIIFVVLVIGDHVYLAAFFPAARAAAETGESRRRADRARESFQPDAGKRCTSCRKRRAGKALRDSHDSSLGGKNHRSG